jgi:drug/metabolite transporter (DMT)-like permease
MVYFPVLGALALSFTAILEKLALRKRKIPANHLIVALFFSAVIIMIPLMLIFGKVSSEIFQLKNILILALIIIFAILANICYFYAMKWEKLSNLEPVHLLEPLLVVLFASLFFTSERNTEIIIPAIIAGLALLFSHIKKHHLDFNKYILVGILGSIFYASEIMLSKLILEFYNPLGLYFFRGLFVLGFMAIIFRPNIFKEVKGKNRWMILLTGSLWVFYRVLAYYGYMRLGIVFTTLILMLSPVFIYLFSWKFLKEKLEWRNIVSAVVIVLCVLYVLFI